MGGACNGATFVAQVFEREMFGACRDCHFLQREDGEARCQVLDGRDSALNCPELSDHIRFHGIKLYGENRP